LRTGKSFRHTYIPREALLIIADKILIIGDRNEPDSNTTSIAEHTRGMIFLGTPFWGSGTAFWRDQPSKLVFLCSPTNSSLISGLQEKSQQFHALAIAFPELLMKRSKAEYEKLRVFFCYETLEYKHEMVLVYSTQIRDPLLKFNRLWIGSPPGFLAAATAYPFVQIIPIFANSQRGRRMAT
jgi:hypothetical protein